MGARTTPATGRRGERGAALVSALLLLLIVSVLGMALNSLAVSDVTVSGNTQDAHEALALAESGLAHGQAILIGTGVDFTNLLRRGDGQGCTGDELAGNPLPPVPAGYPTGGDLVPATGRVFGAGRYLVTICDDHQTELTLVPPNANPSVDVNNRILVRSVGFGRNGASAAVETTIVRTGAGNLPGLVVDGNLRISGNPDIEGDGVGTRARNRASRPRGPSGPAGTLGEGRRARGRASRCSPARRTSACPR
jgi:hypothetical protein